jgi:hypothetical protein
VAKKKKIARVRRPRNPLNQDLNLHNKHVTDRRLDRLETRVHDLAGTLTTVVGKLDILESRVNGLNLTPYVIP